MTRMLPPVLPFVGGRSISDGPSHLHDVSQSGERLVRGRLVVSTCKQPPKRPRPHLQGRHTMRRIIITTAATAIAAAAFVVTAVPAFAEVIWDL